MRIVESCLVLAIIAPEIAQSVQTPPAPVPPPPTVVRATTIKIKTGHANLLLTDAEKERQVLQRTAALSTEAIEELYWQAQQGQVQKLMDMLPQWTHLIPLPVILHIGFKDDDDDLTRAKKYLRLGLLVRDMYQDLPLMHALRTFETTAEQRLDDHTRHALVGEAFATAAAILQVTPLNLSGAELVDYWLSLAQLEFWSLHQMTMVPERLSEALVLAQHAIEDANRARRAMERPSPILEQRINQVREYAQRFIASIVGPALYLAMIQVQSSKKGF